jgi:basic membrane protein A
MALDNDNHDASGDSGLTDETTRYPVRRRSVLASGAVLGGTMLTGCMGGDEGNGGDDDPLQVAIISSNAGFDDNAFNDMAREGLQRASEDYDIEINEIEETDIAQFGDTQAEAAEAGNELVVLVGFQHTEALQDNAPDYPDTNWMLINDDIDEPNVAGYVWANHEMSYLAGVQAGTMTSEELSHDGSSTDPDSASVGFVGGEEVPLIEAFERAYVAGAEWVDDSVEVATGYAGSFNDPSAAENVAESQYDAGADIVYHAAAASGPGVFDAAQNADRFAIGVDADQSVTLEEYSDVIIGSAVKYIDQGTYDCVEATVNDNWEEVSGFNVVDLSQEGVDLVIGQEFEDSMPDVLHENLEEAKQGIIDGDIDVPCEATGC